MGRFMIIDSRLDDNNRYPKEDHHWVINEDGELYKLTEKFTCDGGMGREANRHVLPVNPASLSQADVQNLMACVNLTTVEIILRHQVQLGVAWEIINASGRI